MPAGNTGLHHARTAENFGALSEFVIKVKTYKKKGGVESGARSLYKSQLNEVRCVVDKHYIQHWAFENIPTEFMVDNTNAWDPHPINITHVAQVCRNYLTLAASDRGPYITEHRNTLAT